LGNKTRQECQKKSNNGIAYQRKRSRPVWYSFLKQTFIILQLTTNKQNWKALLIGLFIDCGMQFMWQEFSHPCTHTTSQIANPKFFGFSFYKFWKKISFYILSFLWFYSYVLFSQTSKVYF
jgi:hypothetical protein